MKIAKEQTLSFKELSVEMVEKSLSADAGDDTQLWVGTLGRETLLWRKSTLFAAQELALEGDGSEGLMEL